MKRNIVIFLMAILLGGTLASTLAQGPSGQNNRHVLRVSLIQVIATAKEFDGQRLRIVGYLGHNGIDKAIGVFVSEVDGRNSVLSNSVDLHLEESFTVGLIGKYVVFTGTFHAPVPRSGYNGYIDQILDMKAWNVADAPK